MERNSSMLKAIKAGILIFLVGGFLAYTVHKIYIGDPQVYALKIELFRIDQEAKTERAKTIALAGENKEAIIEIKNNFRWIRQNQNELRVQNNEILKVLKELKK